MNIKNILFPTDFSKYNDAAMQYASRLAAESDAKLYILHVHDTRDLGTAMGEVSYVYSEQWEKERHRAEKRLQGVVPPDPAVPYEHHSLLGAPELEIVSFATDHHMDLIVMASHGRSGLVRLVMGSVAEAVMRKAPCPVLVVKQPQETSLDSTDTSATKAQTELLT
jgi:nucleotide-binding universal stress UspA family protein